MTVAVVVTQPADATTFFYQDFDDNQYGTYLQSDYIADFPGASPTPYSMSPGWTQATGHAYTSGTSYGAGQGLKLRAEAGQVTSGDSGFSFRMPFDDANGQPFSTSDIWLQYRVKFLDGFDFQNGGKLLGIGSDGGLATGGKTVDNTSFTDYDDIGWSVRTWFDNVDDQSPDSTQGRLGLYVYHYDRPNNTGEAFDMLDGWGGSDPGYVVVDTDQWYTIQIRVVDGTPGNNDGILRAWVDGQLVFHNSSMRWGEDELNPADALIFNFFYGGSNPAIYGPDNDSQLVIDDISLRSGTTSSATVPEPATLSLLVMGWLLASRVKHGANAHQHAGFS
ncbi:MAG: polysaccharide lyase [Planctomycetota bacterium]